MMAECAALIELPAEDKLKLQVMVDELSPDKIPKLGRCKLVEHKIELVDGARPVRHIIRRMSEAIWNSLREETKKLLAMGVVENKATKPRVYPIPNIDGSPAFYRGSTIMSKIDWVGSISIQTHEFWFE